MSAAELQEKLNTAELAVITSGDDMELRQMLLVLREIAKSIEAMAEAQQA